jgi:hypothetical protein
VTCGPISEDELRGNVINTLSEPSKDLSVVHGAGRILVKYTEAVQWSFSLEECQTWFVCDCGLACLLPVVDLVARLSSYTSATFGRRRCNLSITAGL